MTHVDLQTILTNWKDDPGAIVLYATLVVLAAAYGLAARRRSPRGRRWPIRRTVCFLAGLALLGVIYGSGLQIYEDRPAVHVVQHMLPMMAVAPLLVLGAPITLLLRTLEPRRRPTVLRLLNDPSFAMLSGPRAPLMLTLDYYLTMYVYQLTPLHTWSEQSPELHFLVHQYFLLCGLFFWWPVIAIDPVRLRLNAGARRTMVVLGLPAFGLLGAIELAARSPATGWSYLVAGTILTLGGLAVVGARTASASARVVRPSAVRHSGPAHAGALSEGSLSGRA